MERLTVHPFIMRIHGFCGVSVITEMGSEKIGPIVNRLEPRDKLMVAWQVAESIAAVHEIDGVGKPASLVHNDINLDNVFWGEDGPLLNDFNIAVLMMKKRDTNTSCPFLGHFPNPQWKAPEEQSSPNGIYMNQLNEKVDVYALGNLLFQFATGKAPWRDLASNKDGSLTSEEKDKIARMKAGKGALPKVPEATLELNDPYINIILKAMKKCYRFKSEERPSAREIVHFLKKSFEQLDDDSD
jgi:serine/threonine protein kinase